MNQCVTELKHICESHPTITNCQYFLEYISIHYINIDKDVNNIKKMSRQKRSPKWFSGGGTLERLLLYSTIAGVVLDMGIDKMLINKQAEKSRILAEQLQTHLDVSGKSHDLYEQLFNESSVRIDQLGTEVNKLNANNLSQRKLNDLLHIATLSLMQHYRDTNRFLNMLSNNVRTNIFTIINVDEFLKLANETNQALLPEYHLPIFNSDSTMSNYMDLCSLTSSHNTTHIKLTVELPILPVDRTALFEFVPIPTKVNNDTVILNSNAMYFIDDENIKIIPNEVLQRCIRDDYTSFCNSMLNDSLIDPDDCTLGFILNLNNTEVCDSKPIKTQNYLIPMTESSMYCFITTPISIEITCDSFSKKFNISKNTEVRYSGCQIYKISKNRRHVDNVTTVYTVESSYPTTAPNFTVVDLNSTHFPNFVLVDNGNS